MSYQPASLLSHTARPLRRKQGKHGERLAWRLVGLLSELLRRRRGYV